VNITLYEESGASGLEYEIDDSDLVTSVSNLLLRLKDESSYCRIHNPQRFHLKLSKDRDGLFEAELEDWRFNDYRVAAVDVREAEAILRGLLLSQPLTTCLDGIAWLVEGKIYPETPEDK
jgi:hypothetical protein